MAGNNYYGSYAQRGTPFYNVSGSVSQPNNHVNIGAQGVMNSPYYADSQGYLFTEPSAYYRSDNDYFVSNGMVSMYQDPHHYPVNQGLPQARSLSSATVTPQPATNRTHRRIEPRPDGMPFEVNNSDYGGVRRSQARRPPVSKQYVSTTTMTTVETTAAPTAATARVPTEKLFFCKKCGSGCTLLENLKRHEKDNCGKNPKKAQDKPICRACGRKFKRQDSVYAHYRSQHKDMTCKECMPSVLFLTPEDLIAHQLEYKHEGARGV